MAVIDSCSYMIINSFMAYALKIKHMTEREERGVRGPPEDAKIKEFMLHLSHNHLCTSADYHWVTLMFFLFPYMYFYLEITVLFL